MILFDGGLLHDDELDTVLEKLWDFCLNTINTREDISKKVIDACDRVSKKLKNGEYDGILTPLFSKGTFTRKQFEEVLGLFDRENLQLKYDVELGNLKKEIADDHCTGKVKRIQPLGILFHVAAGNAEGLPFYSVLEGLLAGNINLLKLPSMDDGVSVFILHELIKEEPAIQPYICVLDVSSTNMNVMKKLADMADGIVVWGGDAAIQAIRSYADPNTQIISWGHKLSFAYVTADVLSDLSLEQELYDLAHHMFETRQVLCSSCQGLFVDSDDEAVVRAVGEKYFEILMAVSREYSPEPIGVRGKVNISLYNEELENKEKDKTILKENGISVIVSRDSRLELSFMYRNCWVKPLPEEDLVKNLKAYKGYLQTAGLICKEEERSILAEKLVKAGVIRITHGGNMSEMIPGEAHDGEYPLRRYCKIVEIE